MAKGKGKAKAKYYAVRKGHIPGIYRDWEEADQQINGFPGAIYKSCKLKRDAEFFMKRSEIQDLCHAQERPRRFPPDQNHSKDKEGNKENQKTEVESLNDNQRTSDVILLDEYDYNIELKRKLLSQENDLKNLWNYVDSLWDDCQQNRKRLLHLESVTKVNLSKDNDDIQKFSPSTPVRDKTIQTPSLPTQSFPSNQENSIYPSWLYSLLQQLYKFSKRWYSY